MNITKIVSFSAILLSIACSTPPTLKDLNTRSSELVTEARDLKNSGKIEEALKMIDGIEKLHPDEPILKEIRSAATPEQIESVTTSEWLGYNKGIRAKEVPTTMERVLWYLPDRIFDFIDQFEAWISFGPQIGLRVHATKYLQGSAFTGAYAAAGGGQKKMLGLKTESRLDVGIGPIVGTGIASAKAGTGGLAYTATGLWLHTPDEDLYQDYEDFWGLGFQFGLVFVGLEFEYHPVEIFDFVAGIFLFDPLNDDFATSRRLKFTSRQSKTVEAFTKTLRTFEKEDIEAYKKQFPKLEIAGSTPAKTEEVAPKSAKEAPPAKTPKKR